MDEDSNPDDLLGLETATPLPTTFEKSRTMSTGVFGGRRRGVFGRRKGPQTSQKTLPESPMRSKLTLTRTASLPVHPKVPTRQSIQRSHSVNAASSSQMDLMKVWGENNDPNLDLDAIERLPHRKKLRIPRRHSTFDTRNQSSSSSSSTLPPDLNWLIPEESPRHLDSPFQPFAATSPTTTSSSRKRIGSPLSDTDDWMILSQGSSDTRRTRSRSRIFSDDHFDQAKMPEFPDLHRSHTHDSSDDDNEDHHLVDSDVDSSFELPDAPLTVRNNKSNRLLDHLANPLDLDFLIAELDKESRRNTGFLGCVDGFWRVTPHNGWTSQRRVGLVRFCQSLGFSIRSVGMGITFAQISQARGQQVLERLRAVDCQSGAADESQPSLVFSPAVPPSPRMSEIAEASPMTMDVDHDLLQRVTALSMTNESKPPLPPPRSSLESFPRPSLDNSRYSVASRTSVASFRPSESGIQQNPLLFLQSPRNRPPKLSLTSLSATPMVERPTPTTYIRTYVELDPNSPVFMSFFSPLTCEAKGWGSRPIVGRDWGTSECYDSAVIAEMVKQFEEACDDETVGPDDDDDFEDEILAIIDSPVVDDAKRLAKRRQSNYNKRKRMSLFAAATGAKLMLPRRTFSVLPTTAEVPPAAAVSVGTDGELVQQIFGFLDENFLVQTAARVCREWADWSTDSYVQVLLQSVESLNCDGDPTVRDLPLEWSWNKLNQRFPWACFLAQGGAKTVYQVFDKRSQQYRALSVMDAHYIDNIQIVANELAVSAMLSSLVRRGVCPNFILMSDVFTCAHPPADSHWGNEDEKCPKGNQYDATSKTRAPREPKQGVPGRFQYIEMELVNEGDAEELLKREPNGVLVPQVARAVLFQIAFSLYIAAEKYSVKHYDVKLLNIFMQRLETDGQDTVLRYGLGSHVYAVRMPQDAAFIAKLADFGTANTFPESNNLPVAISHFTTLENTPPDMMILGDDAKQGHEHDNFGLGLCMLHLFTGQKPYEEILESVVCPPNLKKKLRAVWENDRLDGFSVIRSVIFDGVDKDDDGNILEGEPDGTFYDTLYRFLVLFGIPESAFQQKTCPKVWKAIFESLDPSRAPRPSRSSRNRNTDVAVFERDCKRFSLRTGNDPDIARARDALSTMEGGMDLLFWLCSFDPARRATALQVLNSKFMEDLRESSGTSYVNDNVMSFMTCST